MNLHFGRSDLAWMYSIWRLRTSGTDGSFENFAAADRAGWPEAAMHEL